ncbi:MAG: YdcF family protein [Treponema sp.]|nr:YdcF family protein [Treponema sp.]
MRIRTERNLVSRYVQFAKRGAGILRGLPLRRKGCGEDRLQAEPRGKAFPLLKAIKILFRIAFFSCLACFCFVVLVNACMILSTRKFVYTKAEEVPEKYTAIVLGAAVYKNRSVSFVFRDRIEGGMELLKNNKVQKVLISGDHGHKSYDEVNTALSYINVMHHFNESDVFLDHAGFSTYDSMYRARDVFCVSDCIVVTQKFHIYRAIYIARKLGLDAIGFIPEEKNPFRKRVKLSWEMRECLARVKAFFSVAFNAKPGLLGQKIPITGDGNSTRD